MENIKLVPIEANGVTAEGVSVNIPGTELEILQVRCAHGMLFCGIFDKTVLEKLNFPAAVFSAPFRYAGAQARLPYARCESARRK